MNKCDTIFNEQALENSKAHRGMKVEVSNHQGFSLRTAKPIKLTLLRHIITCDHKVISKEFGFKHYLC